MKNNYNFNQIFGTPIPDTNEKSISDTKRTFSLKRLLLLMLFFSFASIMNAQNVTVNPGAGSYPTLKNAFDAINLGTHTGAITIDIVGDTSETASAVLNASGTGAASYTSVIVSPSGGVARTITGAFIGHLIDLNGADNVTINGLNAGGNALTISNTALGSSSTIRFTNDATSDTVTNCSVLGSTTGVAAFGVIYFATGTTTGNDGNTISNNIISGAGANLPRIGIYSLGTSTAIDNSGNTINNNSISNFFDAGNASGGVNINTGNSTWTITGNSFFQAATRTYTTGSTHSVIAITSGNGYTITGNFIGGSLPNTGGIPYAMAGTVATRFIGINLDAIIGVVNNIQGNTVTNITLGTSSGAGSTTGVICGINITSGDANIGTVTPNTIGATTGTGAIVATLTTSQGAVVGINSSSVGTISIQNNN